MFLNTNKTLTAKIADFGISKFITRGAENTPDFTTTCQYAAPEVMRDNKFDKASDVYSYRNGFIGDPHRRIPMACDWEEPTSNSPCRIKRWETINTEGSKPPRL